VATLLCLGSIAILAGQLIALAWLLDVIAGVPKPLGCLIGGLIVTEQIFNLEGLGRGILVALGRRDYPFVVAGTLVIAAAYIVANLIVDLLYPILDPSQRP